MCDQGDTHPPFSLFQVEIDQSLDEEEEDDDDEEEEDVKDVKTSKRPASSPADKLKVCFTSLVSRGFIC